MRLVAGLPVAQATGRVTGFGNRAQLCPVLPENGLQQVAADVPWRKAPDSGLTSCSASAPAPASDWLHERPALCSRLLGAEREEQ